MTAKDYRLSKVPYTKDWTDEMVEQYANEKVKKEKKTWYGKLLVKLLEIQYGKRDLVEYANKIKDKLK